MDTHNATHRRTTVALLMAVGIAASVGCSSSEPTGTAARTLSAGTHTYVGAVAGTGALMGVVVDGSRVLAYACDGMPADPVGTTPTVETWFNGTSSGGIVDVKQPNGRLQLQLTDTTMQGTLTLADGRDLRVTGGSVTGAAGLYRAEGTVNGARVLAGWIVAADGQQRGGFGTEVDGTRKLAGTKLLNLSQLTVNLQGLVTARVDKVGITPIPIP